MCSNNHLQARARFVFSSQRADWFAKPPRKWYKVMLVQTSSLRVAFTEKGPFYRTWRPRRLDNFTPQERAFSARNTNIAVLIFLVYLPLGFWLIKLELALVNVPAILILLWLTGFITEMPRQGFFRSIDRGVLAPRIDVRELEILSVEVWKRFIDHKGQPQRWIVTTSEGQLVLSRRPYRAWVKAGSRSRIFLKTTTYSDET